MRAFICLQRPRSYNAKKRPHYQEQLREAYSEYHPEAGAFGGSLYGRAYCFQARPTGVDADNLSKPIWDALRDLAYGDDAQIELRHAGILQLSDGVIGQLDLTSIPDEVADDLIDALGSEPHVLYVEVGPLMPGMYTFGE